MRLAQPSAPTRPDGDGAADDGLRGGLGRPGQPVHPGCHSLRPGPQSAQAQIDHVVPLGDAWQTGAQGWTDAKRAQFANDPIELLAVDGPSNEAKGDSDAASWLPPNKAFRCAYAKIQVAVKAKYALWVTQAEHDALAAQLQRC
ncbi:hypothetical protein acdb102_13850 [Acidothermaceae bacterium B102]|nr:hypothetical protein acdb102_13850 [Acidothermaceae bacterium B102]